MTRRSESATLRARATRIGCSVDELREHDARLEAWCPGCRRWLSEVDSFASNMARPSGRQAECRDCVSRRNRMRVRDYEAERANAARRRGKEAA